ncbi:MAG: 4-hydroxybutyrate CoA-transferase [Chloroflexota bacterium]|nr:MAG: 4-hydroxybutyrate CoA-transferase [Chloroflexota bacterium]
MIVLGRRYADRLVSADEAVAVIDSGSTVAMSGFSSEPMELVDALVAQADRLEGVRLIPINPLREPAYLRPGMEKHFTEILTLFPGPRLQKAVREGRAGYIPNHLFLYPALYGERYLRPDVALIQVSPPDKYGFCSLGISADRSLIDAAKVVVAEMNHMLPRPFGDIFVHVSRLHCFCEVSRPLLPEGGEPIGEIERTIGAYVAALIPDGGVLQVGRGAIPDAVLEALRDHKDIGIHSGMLSDTMVDLVEWGVITGARKEIDHGKMVSMMAIGTDKIYSFMDQNPLVDMRPISYTHNASVIARLSNFIAINSAVEVDLRGQVNAERIGDYQFAAPGGQPDFVRGASYSPGGKSIIAIPSTTRDGKVSRIVPMFSAGAMVTTTAAEADYVVTEYGAAELRGRSTLQRAKALVGIAHPRFREELEAQIPHIL